MYELRGKFNTAKVYAEGLEDSATSQIVNFLSSVHADGVPANPAKPSIAIMPDCHAGKGCVIGFTQCLVSDSVVPSLVGCDIGCGMLAGKLKGIDFDEDKLRILDDACHRSIRSGFAIWDKPHAMAKAFEEELRDIRAPIRFDNAMRSICSLGGGNHFVELDRAEDGYWFVVHTGSRHLGLEIEMHYTRKATVKDRGLGAVTGKDFAEYIHDMRITQKFAHVNREAIASNIFDELHVCAGDIAEMFETVHNYIDTQAMIVRKGAIRLLAGERAIIPMNMSDGSLIVTGKGNPEWNFSGPHGAGRIMSRSQARKELKMSDFEDSMRGIYSTTVNEDTLDESKMVYKPMEDIIAAIGDTCTVDEVVKPVYNFKAADIRARKKQGGKA